MRGAALGMAIMLGACAGPDIGERTAAVIGGTLTPAGMYPATGALLIDYGNGDYQPSCTGTLIAPSAVLTAAHCLDDVFTSGAVPSFTLEHDATLVTAGQVFAGSQGTQHPMFDINIAPTGVGRWFDIGVLLLAAPVPDAPLEILPTPEEIANLTAELEVELVGYGLTTTDGFEVGVKHHGVGDLVQVAEAELLISQPGMQQNCNGDSGGPALVDLGNGLRMVGVVSRSPDDNPVCDHGGVDTRTDSYLEFIHSMVEVPCGGLSGECECTGDQCGGGGCSAGGHAGAPALGLLVVAGLVAFRRRRQGAST